jgi:type I restriction enzyme S subunit
MIPDGWVLHRLESVCKERIVYGIVQAGEHIESGVPYIKSSDVGGSIVVADLAKTSPSIHKKYKRSTIEPGDIIFSLRGNTGETSIVPAELPEANLTQGTARLAVNTKAHNKYLRYQLGSHSVRSRVHAVSKGSTFAEISLADLRQIPVTLPPHRRAVKNCKDIRDMGSGY